MAASLCIRTSTVRVPVASYSCLWYRSSSDFAHPGYNSTSTHSVLRGHFNLHFPGDSWFLTSLNMVVSHLYTFSGVVSEPAHFLLLEPLELTILGYVFMCTYVCVCASVWRPEVDFWLFNHSFWDEVSLTLELPCHCDLPNSATPVMEFQMRATTPLLGHGLQGLNSGTHGCVESKLFTKLPPWLACRFWAPIRCASSMCSIPVCGICFCSPGSTIMDENHLILPNPAFRSYVHDHSFVLYLRSHCYTQSQVNLFLSSSQSFAVFHLGLWFILS